MHVCLFAFLSIPDSLFPNSDSLSLLIYTWWPNLLFFLDTGRLFWPTTSCQPCHPAFLPGFHRFCECACFLWLSTEILCLGESVDCLSILDMYLPVFLLCVCVFLCHGVHRHMNRHSREISIVPAHLRAHTHMQRSLAHAWAAVVTSVKLIRSRSSYNHTYQHEYLCVCIWMYLFFFSLFFWVYLTACGLTLCFSSMQAALFGQQHVVGPATGHFCRAFIASVSVCVSRGWVLRYRAWVKVLIFYHCLACICLYL
jgi:hypothetical protein